MVIPLSTVTYSTVGGTPMISEVVDFDGVSGFKGALDFDGVSSTVVAELKHTMNENQINNWGFIFINDSIYIIYFT